MDPSQWNLGSYHKLGGAPSLPPKPPGRFDLPLMDQAALTGLGSMPTHPALAAQRGYPSLPGHYPHPINNTAMSSLFDQMNPLQAGLSTQYARSSVPSNLPMDTSLYSPHVSTAPSLMSSHDAKYSSKSAFEPAEAYKDVFTERQPHDELSRNWGLSSFMSMPSEFSSLSSSLQSHNTPPPAHSGVQRSSSVHQFLPSSRAPPVSSYSHTSQEQHTRLPSLFQRQDTDRDSVISHKPSSRQYAEIPKVHHAAPPPSKTPQPHSHESLASHSSMARPASRSHQETHGYTELATQHRSIPSIAEFPVQHHQHLQAREFTSTPHQQYYNTELPYTKSTPSSYNTPSTYTNTCSSQYDPISPVMPDHLKDDSQDIYNSMPPKSNDYIGNGSGDNRRKSESFSLEQCIPHDKPSDRSLPADSRYTPVREMAHHQSPSPAQGMLSPMVQHSIAMDARGVLAPTPVQAVADSTTKKGKPKPKRPRKKKNDKLEVSAQDYSLKMSVESYASTMPMTKPSESFNVPPVSKAPLDSFESFVQQKNSVDMPFSTIAQEPSPNGVFNLSTKNTLDTFTTLDTRQVSETLGHGAIVSQPSPLMQPQVTTVTHGAIYAPPVSHMTSPNNPMLGEGVMVSAMQEQASSLSQTLDTFQNMSQSSHHSSMSTAGPHDILAQSVDAAGLTEGMDIFDSDMSYEAPPRPFVTKAAQKQHAAITVNDDEEFMHLANPLSTAQAPPPPPKPPVNSQKSFQNSFLSFLQGAKQETLSEVTMATATTRPQLPKYIPEKNPRRPATYASVRKSKTSTSKMSDDNSESDVEEVEDTDEQVSSQGETVPDMYPTVKAVRINIKVPKMKSHKKKGSKVLAARAKRLKAAEEGALREDSMEPGDVEVPREPTPPPRRVQSARRAKESAVKIKNYLSDESDAEVKPVAQSSGEEKDYDSDKDPAWNPFEDAYAGEDDGGSKRKTPRRTRTRSTRKRSFNFTEKEIGEVNTKLKQAEGFFIDNRTEVDPESYCIWKKDSGRLIQKYEATYDGTKMYHKASNVFSNLTDVMKPHFQPIRVNLVAGNLQFVEVAEGFKPGKGAVQITVDDLAEPFKVFMQIMISQALAPGFLKAVEEEQEEFYIGPLNKIVGALREKKTLVSARISWDAVFQEAVEARPHLDVTDVTATNEHCQASPSETPPAATKCVQLHGAEYNAESLESSNNSETQEFFICDAAARHLEELHGLCHFKFSVYKRCVAKVNVLRVEDEEIENIQILDTCLQNKNWIQQIFSDLTSLLKYSVDT